MLHTNVAELRLLFNTFTRVWSSGGQANLSLQTKDGQTWANLDLHLGPADGHRPGPPEAGGRAGAGPRNHQEQQHCAPNPRPRHRGPAARERDVRRRQDWLSKRQDLVQDQSESPTALKQTETQPVLRPEQEEQEILLTDAASIETEEEVEANVKNTDVIPQLDGPGETTEVVNPKKETEPVVLEMQDNGLAKVVIAPDQSPPTQVFHPKLGIGTAPSFSKIQDKNCIMYTFKKGKFNIEIFP